MYRIWQNVLACPGRALVGEGVLIKECRKKPKPRYFFLFNDILVYGTSVIDKKKYINQHIIPLSNVVIKSIKDNDNPSKNDEPKHITKPFLKSNIIFSFRFEELRNGWMIMSPKKSFCVYATTSKEKLEWMTHISDCIEKLSNSKCPIVKFTLKMKS